MLQRGSWWYIAEPITIFDINRTEEMITAKNDTTRKSQREFLGWGSKV